MLIYEDLSLKTAGVLQYGGFYFHHDRSNLKNFFA